MPAGETTGSVSVDKPPLGLWIQAAFAFMLALVLAANLFADAVRDAFDPRARRFKPASAPAAGGAV